jgi:proline iminopeptidase
VTVQGTLVEVRGTRLFVYDIGGRDAPALVYLHGGPGMGCHEFVRWQGEALGQGLRVIAFDQRGSHHSDPVPDDLDLSEDVLVEDCEALRERLGIERWFVLGHSFGGRLAVRYAVRHPDRARGVLFENPGWNIEGTERCRLPVLARIYQSHGMAEEARECLELAQRDNVFAGGYRTDLLAGVAALGEAWYLHDRTNGSLLNQAGLAPPDEEAHENAAVRLIRHPGLLEDLTPLLTSLASPARLIIGEADLVTSPDQVVAFARAFGAAQVSRVGQAGHFVQGEQPATYTRLVLDFIRGTCQGAGHLRRTQPGAPTVYRARD